MSSKGERISLRSFGIFALAIISLGFFTVSPSYGENYYWFGGVGLWEDSANWSPSGIPGTYDNVWVTNSPDIHGDVDVTTNVTVNSVSLYSTGSESMHMDILRNGNLYSDQLNVNGNVSLYLVGSMGLIGTVNQTGGHVLGTSGLGISGTYNLNAGFLSSNLSGFNVNGVLNQTGGRTDGDELYVRGVYNLSGTGQASFGYAPSEILTGGVFNQNGGTVGLTGLFVGGTYNLKAGELNSGYRQWSTFINGGTFSQSGGTASLHGYYWGFDPSVSLHVGYKFGFVDNKYDAIKTDGTYNLSGGRLEATGIRVGDRLNYSGGEMVLGQKVNDSWAMGTLTNNGNVNLTGTGTRTIDGNVVNNGTFKTTHTTAVYTGMFMNNGAYFSDPAIQHFTDLTVGQTGYLVGQKSDKFYISGDFMNRSTMNTLWNTSHAYLGFINGDDAIHYLLLAAIDNGSKMSAFANNFSWGTLDLTGQNIYLRDGNDIPGGAFYVREILGLDISGNLITNVFGTDGLNIYYMPKLDENRYLFGLTYDLSGGGHLIPDAEAVPEPSTILPLGFALIGLFGIRRKWMK